MSKDLKTQVSGICAISLIISSIAIALSIATLRWTWINFNEQVLLRSEIISLSQQQNILNREHNILVDEAKDVQPGE